MMERYVTELVYIDIAWPLPSEESTEAKSEKALKGRGEVLGEELLEGGVIEPLCNVIRNGSS